MLGTLGSRAEPGETVSQTQSDPVCVLGNDRVWYSQSPGGAMRSKPTCWSLLLRWGPKLLPLSFLHLLSILLILLSLASHSSSAAPCVFQHVRAKPLPLRNSLRLFHPLISPSQAPCFALSFFFRFDTTHTHTHPYFTAHSFMRR